MPLGWDLGRRPRSSVEMSRKEAAGGGGDPSWVSRFTLEARELPHAYVVRTRR